MARWRRNISWASRRAPGRSSPSGPTKSAANHSSRPEASRICTDACSDVTDSRNFFSGGVRAQPSIVMAVTRTTIHAVARGIACISNLRLLITAEAKAEGAPQRVQAAATCHSHWLAST